MQRFLLSLLIVLSSSRLFAQSIEDVEKYLGTGALDKAKEAVDGFLAKEKNQTKADGWWYKGLVYNEISKSDKYKSLAPDARMTAFNAFKKYYELDPKAVRATLEQNVRMFDIYNQYYINAINSFNDADSLIKLKKEDLAVPKYDDAYVNFKNAYAIEEYIAPKGWEYNGFKFASFDTALIHNIATSALNAKKSDEAVIYYKRLADQKIAGKDYTGIYDWLVKYYDKKGDAANKEKYSQLAKELYPDISWAWYEDELKGIDQKDKKTLFAKYEELLPKYPKEYYLYYNYGVELFNYADFSDPRPTDYKEKQVRLESVLKTAIDLDKTKPDANFLMAVHYYNAIYDIQDEQKAIKGTTPADQKKRTDINTRAKEAADKMIQYALPAIDLYASKNQLKASEKGNYKKLIGYVADAYEVKGDKAKAEEYKKKGDSIN
jgi:hypothetical protein